MEPMKISFGFSKRSIKPNIISNNVKQEEKKLELIECLEGQSIKVKDAVDEVKGPLVIPLKDNQKNLLDRIRAAKKRDKQLEQKKDEPEDTRPDSELSADELAARQLLKEAKERLAGGSSGNNTKVSVLPIGEGGTSLEGEEEPTLDDYESVPISDYGLAILRGMGWKDGMAIGKNSSKSAGVSVPELRPKGLGLGATKVVKSEMPVKKAVDQDGNELILVTGCFAKVIAGPQKGNYCEVQGFDEDAGRVIIKVFPRGELVNINESLLTPVTKEEFSRGSKFLNNAKYEEYKEISDKKLDNHRIKSEPSDSNRIKQEIVHELSDSEDEYRHNRSERKSRPSQKDDHKTKHKSESLYRDYERGNTKHKSSKYRDASKSPSRESRKSEGKSSSSKYNSTKKDSTSSSSDVEQYSRREKSKTKYRSRSRSHSKYTSKQDKEYSDEDNYEKDKKNKNSKSKIRDRSSSRDKYGKNKKHSSRRRDSSEDDADCKKDKRKKNKCKSRHRRTSSSSSEDRRYRSKK